MALKTPRLIVIPAQLRTSAAKRLGSGLSYTMDLSIAIVTCLTSGPKLTIVLPLIPMMKSNQGSRARSGFVFLSTWNPNAPCVADCCSSGAASSRAMKRLRAPNMFVIKQDGDMSVSVTELEARCRGLFKDVAIASGSARYFGSRTLRLGYTVRKPSESCEASYFEIGERRIFTCGNPIRSKQSFRLLPCVADERQSRLVGERKRQLRPKKDSAFINVDRAWH